MFGSVYMLSLRNMLITYDSQLSQLNSTIKQTSEQCLYLHNHSSKRLELSDTYNTDSDDPNTSSKTKPPHLNPTKLVLLTLPNLSEQLNL